MKKYFLIFVVALTVASCNRNYDKAMKSADKDYILKIANEQFEKKKWANAIALYERLTNLVAGTDDAANVVFNSAYANYYDENYKLAGHQFKNFSVTFTDDPRKEEAAYMSALCYYEGSMDYNLDQSSTELAINELQNFLNNYPNSERSKNISQLIDELTYKLEFKAYENAKQYVKMAQYKAALVALDNVLNDFPSTKLRPQIYGYQMKSKYELAMNSLYSLKEERLDNAIAFSKQLEKELPGTNYAKDAADYRTKLMREKENFVVLQKQEEARKAVLTAKQKAEEEKMAANNKVQTQMQEQDAAEKKAMQIQRDSATIATPPPAATFKIQR